MKEYRLTARLKGYIHEPVIRKLSQLENDTPYITATPQELTDEQKSQVLANLGVPNCLAGNFVRYDAEQVLDDEEQARARDNIGAIGDEELGVIDSKINVVADFINSETPLETAAETVTEAINELAQRIAEVKPDVDGETVVWANDKLKAVAIEGELSDGSKRKVVPNDIDSIEKRLNAVENKVDCSSPVGGYLTPFDFDWSGGTESSLTVGATFEEWNPANIGEKRTVTVVESGGGYPTNTEINKTEAQAKALRYQLDLTAWATADIWNEAYTPYEAGLSIEQGKAVSVMVKANIEIPIGYWESIASDEQGNEFGLWKDTTGTHIGLFSVQGNEASAITPVLTIADGMNGYAITTVGALTTHEVVAKEYAEPFLSNIDWEEAILFWQGHSPFEICNGTRCINLFNGYAWALANTATNIFSWNVADVGGSIDFANNDSAGVVKTQNTIEDAVEGVAKYGVLLDADKKMYVDRLGVDIAELKELINGGNPNADNEELYDLLVSEGWIE